MGSYFVRSYEGVVSLCSLPYPVWKGLARMDRAVVLLNSPGLSISVQPETFYQNALTISVDRFLTPHAIGRVQDRS